MIKKIILYAFLHFIATLSTLMFALHGMGWNDNYQAPWWQFLGSKLFVILTFPAIYIERMLHKHFGILPFDDLIEWGLIMSNSLLWGTMIAYLIKRYQKTI